MCGGRLGFYSGRDNRIASGLFRMKNMACWELNHRIERDNLVPLYRNHEMEEFHTILDFKIPPAIT